MLLTLTAEKLIYQDPSCINWSKKKLWETKQMNWKFYVRQVADFLYFSSVRRLETGGAVRKKSLIWLVDFLTV